MDAINICKWRTVEFSVKIKVQDFQHVFDMISFFLPEKIGNNFLMGSCYWKKPDIVINWKLLELLIHFIVYIIIRCFHLFIESLHSKISVMFVKWKKRQQRKRLQNKPIGPFCFFVKFNACVVFMDTRLFNYKYRNIKQTSYGNRHF